MCGPGKNSIWHRGRACTSGDGAPPPSRRGRVGLGTGSQRRCRGRHYYSAKAGVGVAPLPIALGDAEPDLVRVIGPVVELTRIWRMLTTAELRHTPRVAAFFDFIVGEIDTLRPILTG